MWRADKHPENYRVEPDLVEPDEVDEHAHAPTQVTAPHVLSRGDPKA